ncbi:hypothetical protein M8C21_004554 [Ambrosia artemisiifolia]|uniref:Uncharacterized protein n=1 Tax=Ambrosia artemisiifolia TaxID=4212 RepID=A0AAD5G1K4_AMBAR|nr:hypothetical protein M8C21_004554 [Ambrosia artemisiifolia]
MGCFFGCFRVRDDRRTPVHLLSRPISSHPKDPVVVSSARNPLSSLLLFDAEDRDQSLAKDKERGVIGSAEIDANLQELKAEDQKVSWHATPFEERLEKALSEDRLIAERKQLGTRPLRAVDLNEKDEHEASSHFESGLILSA